jgi:hypothetical protein
MPVRHAMPDGPIVFYSIDHERNQVMAAELHQGGRLAFSFHEPEVKLTQPMQPLADLAREKTAHAPYAIEDADMAHLLLTLDTKLKDDLTQAPMLEPTTPEAAHNVMAQYEQQTDALMDAVHARLEASSTYRDVADNDPLFEVESHHRINAAFSAHYQKAVTIREALVAKAERTAEAAELDFASRARDVWTANGLDPDDMPDLTNDR